MIEQGRERRWTAADGTALNDSGCGGRADGAERQRIRGTTIEAVIEQVGVGRWNRWNRWHWSAAFQSRRLFSRQRIGGFSVAAASQSRRLLSRSASQSTADGSCTVKGAGSAACRLNRRTAAAPRGASGDGRGRRRGGGGLRGRSGDGCRSAAAEAGLTAGARRRTLRRNRRWQTCGRTRASRREGRRCTRS